MFGNTLSDYFPLNTANIKMDYLYKLRAWQNIPMIKIIQPRIILKLTSSIVLNEENERNQILSDYIIN
jgi:hypothetical protein